MNSHLIWHTLTEFWLHHDLLFTHFGRYACWVHWNLHHFSRLPHIHQWRLWPKLWAWCNVHGKPQRMRAW